MKISFESKIFQTASLVSTLLLYNILWLICCIPVITIGSATTAMYRIIFNVKERKSTSIRTFFAAFREDFKKSTISWIFLLVFSFAAIFYANSLSIFTDKMMQTVLIAILLLVSCPLIIASVYIFPLLSYYDNTLIQTWKNAFTLGLLRLPQTICIVILQLCPLLFRFVWPEWFLRLGILWILLFPSLIMYWNSAIFLKTFHSVQKSTESQSNIIRPDI